MNKLLFRRILMFATGVLTVAGGLTGVLSPAVLAAFAFTTGVLKQVPVLLDENKKDPTP